MPARSSEMIARLLQSTEVVEFKDLQAALQQASRATTFRYLKQVSYDRSYNFNGRFYTRKDSARYDRFGLFSCGEIRFCRDRTLGETLRRLVWESVAGWTLREFQDMLGVRVQVLLLDAVHKATLWREKLGGFYVYVHPESTVRAAQLQRRREQLSAQADARAASEVALGDSVVIQVLLTLLRHPGAAPAEVVRYLRGHSPPILFEQVGCVFAHYELDKIGKKGGSSNC